MLEQLVFRRLTREERRLGAGSFEYLRHLWRTSRSSFWAFARGQRFLQHRRLVPPDVYHVARVVATQVEDCGTCVQVAVNLALADGVAPKTLAAVIAQHYSDLPANLAATAHFAEAVARGDTVAMDNWRLEVRKRLGEAVLGELALAVATARVFPAVKRALGFATACALVKIRIDAQATTGVRAPA